MHVAHTPIPQSGGTWQNGISLKLPLQPDPIIRLLWFFVMLALCAALGVVIVSTITQNNYLKDTITEQTTLFFAALLRISRGTLTVDVVDICPETEQGVFILDNATSPPVAIKENPDVPPAVDLFDLSEIGWNVTDGSFTITGNYTVQTDELTYPCCIPNPVPLGNDCDCVWVRTFFGGRVEGCDDQQLYDLDYQYCGAQLTADQRIGVDHLHRSYDQDRPTSVANKLGMAYEQVKTNTLVVGGNQQLVQTPQELVPAFNHSGDRLLFSDLAGCPMPVCEVGVPEPYGYHFTVFEIIEQMNPVPGANPVAQQVELNECFDAVVFPLTPNPYVAIPPASQQEDVQNFELNTFGQTLLQCGLDGLPAPGQGLLTPSYLFNKIAHVSTPFFPIRQGATYKIEFGCTAINVFMTDDDDDIFDYQPQNVDFNQIETETIDTIQPDLSTIPVQVQVGVTPLGKYQWCAHMYDYLADDDACSLPPPFARYDFARILSTLDTTDSAGVIPQLGFFATQNDATLACCDMRKDLTCETVDNPVGTNSGILGSEFYTKDLPNRVWGSMAFQLYTICVGVNPTSYSSTNGIQSEMFVSVQRVNPMAWATGSEGMSFDLQGHAYWEVNDEVLAANPDMMGQCGVFSGATPWMFNTQQQVVDPSVTMQDVPGFEDIPYPGQANGELPGFNHMCNTTSATLANCYARVRSFMPGMPEVVSSSKKRESKVYEPGTGKTYWQGEMKDMASAPVWELFKEKELQKAAMAETRRMLHEVDKAAKERKRDKIREQHEANVQSIVEKARRHKKARKATIAL